MGYFGWVGVCEALFWVGGGWWGCMRYYFGWVEMSGGGWENILDWQGWVEVSGVGALFDNARKKSCNKNWWVK